MTKPACYKTILIYFLIALSASAAQGQADPTATGDVLYPGFTLPDLQGSLHYALSASQRVSTNYNGSGQTVSSTSVSGDFGYLSRSEKHPFSVIYSGGYLGNTSSGQPSSAFHNLALSQIFQTRDWHFTVADQVSYLPTAPTSGLSGIPGIGDLGVTPVQVGPVTGQAILTSYAPRVNNNASATVQRNLTGSTTIEGSGAYLIQRFVGSPTANGIDNNQTTGIGGITHRFDARNTISGNYTYSSFNYPSASFSFTVQGANLEYIRRMTRRIQFDVSAGPQRTNASMFFTPNYTLAANASVSYTGEATTASVVYLRATNAGSGVVQGARSDTVNLSATRRLRREWTGAAFVGYSRTNGLTGVSSQGLSSDIVLAGVQANRKIGDSLSVFLSYSAQQQSAQGLATVTNTQNGISNILAVGLTYSPSLIHLGHQ
jgi:hypothetical protein